MKAIPVNSSEAPRRSSPQPDRRSWLRRHKGVPAGLAGVMLLAAAAVVLNPFENESSPAVELHMTLKGCNDGNKDTPPQPIGVYRGQSITLGIGKKVLDHTVSLTMQDSGEFMQTHVDEGVTLVAGANQTSTGPEGQPRGIELRYTLKGNQQVTVTAHPEMARPSQPVPVDIQRSC